MDRGAWQATVHGITESQTWLSNWACTLACGEQYGLGPDNKMISYKTAFISLSFRQFVEMRSNFGKFSLLTNNSSLKKIACWCFRIKLLSFLKVKMEKKRFLTKIIIKNLQIKFIISFNDTRASQIFDSLSRYFLKAEYFQSTTPRQRCRYFSYIYKIPALETKLVNLMEWRITEITNLSDCAFICMRCRFRAGSKIKCTI